MKQISDILKKTVICNLSAPHQYMYCLRFEPSIVKSVCDSFNCPSTTVLGQDITPATNILFWRYTFPLYYPWISTGETAREQADQEFLENCQQLLQGGFLGSVKMWVVENFHFPFLRKYGSRAFWNSKIIPRDWVSEKIPFHCNDLNFTWHPEEARFILGDRLFYIDFRTMYENFKRK